MNEQALTTGAALAAAAARWPHREALVMDASRYTWAALDEAARLHARALIGLGIGHGDHVALLMPNCADYVVLFHAITLIGARAVTLNARYREDELAYVLAHSDARLLFIGGHALPHVDSRALLGRAFPALSGWDGRAALALAAAPLLQSIVNFDDPRETSWPARREVLAAAGAVSDAALAARARAVTGADIAIMMFSSGTTAHPKACLLTHESLTRTGAAFAERFRLTPDDRIIDPLPLFHMSTMLPLAAARHAGSCFVGFLHFDAGAWLASVERERITVSYTSFPTMMSAIVSHRDFSSRDLSSLRVVHCVGPADLLRRYADAFPRTHIVNAYGLTEATGVPVYSDLDDTTEIAVTTSGRPFDGVEARIVDPETEADLGIGASGEIQLRGFCLFAGYYKDADATARVFTQDGWLRTGDLGSRDAQNRVTYEGRIKDMLKIGGENVAAVELESFLCTHPDVLVAQAIGVPDDHLLEVAAAFLELSPGATLTEAALIDYCIGRIASFKIPRYVRFVREWPMSATKIQKHRLLRAFEPTGKFDVKSIVAQRRTREEDRS